MITVNTLKTICFTFYLSSEYTPCSEDCLVSVCHMVEGSSSDRKVPGLIQDPAVSMWV